MSFKSKELENIYENVSGKLEKLTSKFKDELSWFERDQLVKELQVFVDMVFNEEGKGNQKASL